jgi:hypothetical protein
MRSILRITRSVKDGGVDRESTAASLCSAPQ